MASTYRPHGQGTAQRPADRLWEHQLRRENKALLEQIKEIGKRREADYAESERKRQETEERLDAIETKLTGFGHELREAVRASEKTATELRTAFSRLGERIGGRAANGRLRVSHILSRADDKQSHLVKTRHLVNQTCIRLLQKALGTLLSPPRC